MNRREVRPPRWLLHLQFVLHSLHALHLACHRGGLAALGLRFHGAGEVHHAILGRDADAHHLERGLVVDGLLHPGGNGGVVEERVAAPRGCAAGEAEQRDSDDECEAMLELAHFHLPRKSATRYKYRPQARPAKEKPHAEGPSSYCTCTAASRKGRATPERRSCAGALLRYAPDHSLCAKGTTGSTGEFATLGGGPNVADLVEHREQMCAVDKFDA